MGLTKGKSGEDRLFFAHERDRASHCIRDKEHGTYHIPKVANSRGRKPIAKFRPQGRNPNYEYADCSGEVGDDDFTAIDPRNQVQKNPQKSLEEEKPFSRKSISKQWYERRSKRRARINRRKSDV